MILGAGRRKIFNSHVTTGKEEAESEQDVESDVEKTSANSNYSNEQDSELEPWVDWVQRVTHKVEDQMKALNFESWVITARRHKWNLAHRITNHDPKRWTWRLLAWNPEIHFDGKICRAARKRARPRARWTDDLNKFSEYKNENSDWITMVRDKTSWTNNAKEYSCGDWRANQCSKKEI